MEEGAGAGLETGGEVVWGCGDDVVRAGWGMGLFDANEVVKLLMGGMDGGGCGCRKEGGLKGVRDLEGCLFWDWWLVLGMDGGRGLRLGGESGAPRRYCFGSQEENGLSKGI